MQTSNDLPIPQPGEHTQPVYESRQEMMEGFYRKMGGMFGRTAWQEEFGDIDGEWFKAWTNGLMDLTEEQIRAGINALMRDGREVIPNIIKFNRLCRENCPTKEQTTTATIGKRRQHFSVMRIERAKQKALLGEAFPVSAHDQNRLVMDWTDQDEQQLQALINQWDPATELKGLNKLIDQHPFSSGTHYAKTHVRATPGGFD